MLWQLIATIIERGLPTHPAYYISGISGIIFGFLSHRLTIKAVSRSHERLLGICILLMFVLIWVFRYLGIEILVLTGSGLLFWYLFSNIGLWIIYNIKHRRSLEDLSEKEYDSEHYFKGVVFIFVAFFLACLPILIFALIAIILS